MLHSKGKHGDNQGTTAEMLQLSDKLCHRPSDIRFVQKTDESYILLNIYSFLLICICVTKKRLTDSSRLSVPKGACSLQPLNRLNQIWRDGKMLRPRNFNFIKVTLCPLGYK